VNTLPAIKCALILLSVCCLSACNQEKAQALQLAATTFSNEADRTCKMGADSLQAAVAMPALTRSDIATSLAQAKKFGATELDLIYADNSSWTANVTLPVTAQANDKVIVNSDADNSFSVTASGLVQKSTKAIPFALSMTEQHGKRIPHRLIFYWSIVLK